VPSKMRSLFGKLGLLLGGTLLGILAAESIARTIAPHQSADLLFNSSDASPMNLYVIDKQTRLRPNANLDTTIQSLDYTVKLRTNALGLRGPTVTSVTAEQWIALGDSFTMSVQVNEEDSFAGLLGAEKNVHVWNGGVDGFSTWQASLRLKQMAVKLPIKRAILTFFTGNDFQDNERFPAMARMRLPGQEGTPIPRPSVGKMDLFLLQHSFLYAHYRIWNKQQQVQSGKDMSRGNWQDELRIFSTKGTKRLDQLEKKTTQALLDFKNTCLKLNIEPLVAIAPPAFVIDQARAKPTFELVGLDANTLNLDAPQIRVEKILSKLKIPSCTLTNALRETSSNYLVFDGHWSKEGHQVAAKTISECLEDK
jgi:hypothetical protein